MTLIHSKRRSILSISHWTRIIVKGPQYQGATISSHYSFPANNKYPREIMEIVCHSWQTGSDWCPEMLLSVCNNYRILIANRRYQYIVQTEGMLLIIACSCIYNSSHKFNVDDSRLLIGKRLSRAMYFFFFLSQSLYQTWCMPKLLCSQNRSPESNLLSIKDNYHIYSLAIMYYVFKL